MITTKPRHALSIFNFMDITRPSSRRQLAPRADRYARKVTHANLPVAAAEERSHVVRAARHRVTVLPYSTLTVIFMLGWMVQRTLKRPALSNL